MEKTTGKEEGEEMQGGDREGESERKWQCKCNGIAERISYYLDEEG